jgi:hypothetical protein
MDGVSSMTDRKGEHARRRLLWCIVAPSEWEETYTYVASTKRMTPSIRQGSRVKPELLLDAHLLRSFGFSLHENSDSAVAQGPFLKELQAESGLYHFLGRVLGVHRLNPISDSASLNRGLIAYYADIESVLPLSIGGLLAPTDPLLDIEGRWIEGVAMLWGNLSRPHSPGGRQVNAFVRKIRSFAPIRRDSHILVYRFLGLEPSSPGSR